MHNQGIPSVTVLFYSSAQIYRIHYFKSFLLCRVGYRDSPVKSFVQVEDNAVVPAAITVQLAEAPADPKHKKIDDRKAQHKAERVGVIHPPPCYIFFCDTSRVEDHCGKRPYKPGIICDYIRKKFIHKIP